MKVLIIYWSMHHGNTEKIAREMAEAIKADLIDVKDLQVEKLNQYDLIGFGSGIYAGRFHRKMLNLIDKLPELNNKKAFVFSTSGLGSTKYNLPVEKALEKHGLEVIGSFACKGYDTFGPLKLFGGVAKRRPNKQDLQEAKEFAERLISS